MLQDLKQAARMLLQTKGWTAVVLLSLALGIGANTALFSAVNALLLRTVPVPQPETLVRLRYAGPNDMKRSSSGYGYNGKSAAGEDVLEGMSYPTYQVLRAANQTLTDIAASAPIASPGESEGLGGAIAVVDGNAELATALLVSGNYFQLLNVPALIGRTLTPDDDSPSSPPVAIISYGYWQKRFSGNPAVLGKAIRMKNVPVTIVGITPQDFTGIQSLQDSGSDVTLPLALDPQLNPGRTLIRLSDGTNWWLQLVGRLIPGISPLQVRGNLDGVFQATAREGWTSYLASLTPSEQALSFNQNHTAVPHLEVDSASSGLYPIAPNTLRSAWILSAVVGLMLLIVCANVANLLLSRASSRQREIAVRLAVGATRTRLIRQLLTESLLLSCLGGILGILVGFWSRQLLPFARSAPLDWRVITFALLLCIATGIAFGMAPALRATSLDLSGAMKETSHSLSRARTLLSKSLLVVQVAISLAVLIGAGLFLRTLQNLRNVPVGFNSQNLVVFSIDPKLKGYDAVRARPLYDQLHRYIATIPGVRAVSHSGSALFDGGPGSTPMFIEGKPENARPDGKGQTIESLNVSPEFFDTLEMPLLGGRNLESRDALPRAPAVAVINEAAARKFFPNEDPLGKRFGYIPEQAGYREIVGVVRDAKYDNLRNAPPPISFQPFVQSDFRASFEVRFSGPLPPLIQAIREAVQKTDPNLPLVRITTQNDLLAGQLDQERFFAMAYSLFGGLALLLTSIGLFGLMSYSVARRTNEIGIRMALGAERRDMVRMVLRESLIMVAIGIAVGIAITLAAGQFIRTMLFGLGPTDAVTVASATLIMLAVSMIASYLPARRASRIDPMSALHYE